MNFVVFNMKKKKLSNYSTSLTNKLASTSAHSSMPLMNNKFFLNLWKRSKLINKNEQKKKNAKIFFVMKDLLTKLINF